jgi:hypothetical protein
VQIL